MRTRHTAALLLAAAGLTALTACSSSSSHDNKPTTAPPTKPTVTPTKPPTTPPTTAITRTPPATPPTGDTAALEQAVKAYSKAFFRPDPDAGYALMTKRCQAKISKTDYASGLTNAVALYGHQTLKTIHVDRISGDLATVTYTYADSALTQTGQAWAKEDGDWKRDAC